MLGRQRRAGQVVVEMVLILPFFLGVVFMIMEIGFTAFRVIVLNHATYEVARIAGMTSATPNLNGPPSVNNGNLNNMMKRILPEATVSCCTGNQGCDGQPSPGQADPQSGQYNYDLICTGTQTVQLITGFNPISSFALSDKGHLGQRTLQAVVRMPVEQPFAK